MSTNSTNIEKVVIKFCGDSGDGMQLTGTQFTDTSALFGNDLATFPDFPAEIRAPVGTVAGVSGFQVHIGNTKIHCLSNVFVCSSIFTSFSCYLLFSCLLLFIISMNE